MAEKAVRNEGAKRAVAGEPNNGVSMLKRSKNGDQADVRRKRSSFLYCRNPKLVWQARNPAKIGIVSQGIVNEKVSENVAVASRSKRDSKEGGK